MYSSRTRDGEQRLEPTEYGEKVTKRGTTQPSTRSAALAPVLRPHPRLNTSEPLQPSPSAKTWIPFKSQIILFQALRDRTAHLALLPSPQQQPHRLLHHNSPLASAPPTPSRPPLIPTNNNNTSTSTNPHFVTFTLTLQPSNMLPVTLAELSQISARIYSSKLSARASSERLNLVSTQIGPKKSLSSS